MNHMISLSRKKCYFITVIFAIVSFLCGKYFFEKNIDFNMLAFLFVIHIATYVMYIFLPAKRFYAYINAFISTVVINFTFFWPIYPEILYCEIKCSQGHEAIPDIVIDAYILIIIPIILSAFIFSLVYWLNFYIQGKKYINKGERSNNVNEK